jgi:tetratricopeptide (TPR) repeat protein
MSEDQTPTSGPVAATIAEPTVTPLSPPDYELLHKIGRGGMGVVYRARDAALDRDVAVKLLAEHYQADSPPAQRFLSEARITGQLQHPGIPAVHQVGTLADGRPFLAMKLIKGCTLDAILKQRGDPSAGRGRLLGIFEAVCQAVGYAHAHRVIHRDLKPANVMVGAFGEVQVMDWGLAKVLGQDSPATVAALAAEPTRAWSEVSPTPEGAAQTQAGSLVGTPAYIAPEQAAGELGKVDERADVFGLGALLAVILTGKPPYVAESFETVRVQAVRGKLDDCFARLDASGAEPELLALCKQCLAFEPADRPADAGAVAAAVAGLRAAADERARRAELERVRVEGEQATAQAQAAERRKRRRLVLVAAAVLALAAVGGLSAVLAVQRRANAVLVAKNTELDDERAKVEQRFALAQKAIALFHTGVSEDFLLKNKEFQQLRTKLLKEAKGFYEDAEKLLAGQTDARSRQTLAAAYFQLGELTGKIGDKKEALAVHRKALALRRELATAAGADVEARLDVARSLDKMGLLLRETGNPAGALAAWEEQRDLAAALLAESPTDAVRAVLASGQHGIGLMLSETGKPAEALRAFEQARDVNQKLVDANPTVTAFQSELARNHNMIGVELSDTGKLPEALREWEQARDIRQKLADANPAVTKFQSDLAQSHVNIGWVLERTGKRAEALRAHEQERDIIQNLVKANPAATQFQQLLARSQNDIGRVLEQTGKPAEALRAFEQARDIYQKLADANPAVTDFQRGLAFNHNSIGGVLFQTGKPAEALRTHEQARDIYQKLVDANTTVTQFQSVLAWSHNSIGDVLVRTGRPAEALRAMEQARDIHQKLADANPAVIGFQSDLAGSHGNVADTLRRMGEPTEALEGFRKVLPMQQKLVDANPANTSYQRTLADIHKMSGEVLGRQKRFAEAFAAFEASLSITLKLAEAGPKNTGFIDLLGATYASRGGTRVWAGQPAEAAADLRRALELWDKIPTVQHPDNKVARSQALALLAGLGGDAKSGVTKDEVKKFADQSVALLAELVKSGWGSPTELKEPDFDALRGRADFQKLVADLKAKSEAESKPRD